MGKKEKKVKKERLYFIAGRPEEELETYSLSTMEFLADIPRLNGECSFTIGIVEDQTLVYSRLKSLTEDYLWGWEDDITPDDEEAIKILRDRSEKFFGEFGLMVCKLDIETQQFSVMKDDVVRSFFKRVLHKLDKKAAPAPPPPTKFPKPLPEHYGPFTRELSKCFGKYKSGTLTFSFLDSKEASVWDVERNDKGHFRFGPDMAYSALFAAKLISFFRRGSSLCVRVFTDQSKDGIPFKELYAFILTPDFAIHNMDYRMVEKAYNMDHSTRAVLDPEKNVVYCDLQNNKLPSFDIE
ncbi:MAG TPA: hypothetical protein VFX43_17000 [Chitinophagaceae bacterium]|nr:hypothetical protein [Chitinophagaceae bacterium]